MTGPIFDTHAHYSSRAFDADRFALLDSLPGKGVVGVCEQATHSGDAPRVLELARRYPWVVAAIGIHPESLLPAADCGEDGPAPTVSVYGGDWAAEMQVLTPYYDDPKVVAVGECGLDYHWPVPKDAQLALFEAEIRLALELDKPIIVRYLTWLGNVLKAGARRRLRAAQKVPSQGHRTLLFRQRRGCCAAGGAGAVYRLWRCLHLQWCQARSQGHRSPAAGRHRAGDRLPLHGTGAGARHPL